MAVEVRVDSPLPGANPAFFSGKSTRLATGAVLKTDERPGVAWGVQIPYRPQFFSWKASPILVTAAAC